MFVRRPDVEPTDNAGEQAIWPGVLWRKGNFGTQSAEHSRCAAAYVDRRGYSSSATSSAAAHSNM
jgi:hypothetical protein